MRKRLISLVLAAVSLLSLSACGGGGRAVSVQLAESLAQTGRAGNRYAAMVVSEDAAAISRDSSKSILELYVSVGDQVKAGDKLFTYDSEALELELEKQQLELEKMKNEQISYTEQLAKLEQQLASTWNETEKSRITLEINTLKTTQLENDYSIIAKENSIADIQQVLANIDVFSPVDGTVRQINEDDPSQSYITIQRQGAYRLKGSLNEMNMYGIMPGSRVRAVSRVDSAVVWLGTVTSIDTEDASQYDNSWYGYTDTMSSSSSYAFYVELDSTDGLLLGQHVYVELLPQELEGLWIPESFLFDIAMDEETFELTACVWAVGSGDKLESRSVTLGMYDDVSGCYEILSGISSEDWLADPNDPGCSAGAAVSRRSGSDFTGGAEG